MGNVVVLAFVALLLVGAFLLAGRLRPVRERDAAFARRRAALLGGTLRAGRHGLPLAVLELRSASGWSMLFASFADDAVYLLEGGAGQPVRGSLFEPQGERGRRPLEAFHAELRSLAASAPGPAAADPPPGTVTLHRRVDAGPLQATLAGPLDRVRGGAHPLAAADRLARAVGREVFHRTAAP